MSNFKKGTEQGIIECGKWMIDNADQLSSVIVEGCTDWSIVISWSSIDENVKVPKIDISVSKYPSRKAIEHIIDSFNGVDSKS